jgi:(S)-mandelate dehydrogenase
MARLLQRLCVAAVRPTLRWRRAAAVIERWAVDQHVEFRQVILPVPAGQSTMTRQAAGVDTAWPNARSTGMNVDQAVNVSDLRRLARRRLPKILFDWVDGGAEDEAGLARNTRRFSQFHFLPRCLVDVSARNTSCTLFGRRYDLPFGIAPTGFAGLLRPHGDLALAAAARDANIPFVLSGTSVASLETIARCAPEHAWYQLYAARSPSITADLIRRARDAGVPCLVVTVDLPVEAKRERDIRNGFALPPRMTARLFADLLRHPGWTLDYLRAGGLPVLANWAPYAADGADGLAVANLVNAQSYPVQTWRDLEGYRRQWPGRLILKGVMHPDDARRAEANGVDAIIVSNHGGRQIDRVPACLDLLAPIKAALGDRVPVMMDGGIRRGADVLIALCLGACFVFTGRATLYGAIAGGERGAARAIAILRDEIDRAMGQIGCGTISALDVKTLVEASSR